MKKILFIATLMAVVFASCKKESTNDPTPQDPAPVVVNDSLDLKLRVYATKHQMEYLNYQVYITFPGETKEQKIDMTNPVQLDKDADAKLLRWIENSINSDSVLVYTLNTRVKKGSASYRFEYAKADSMPELIDLVFGIRFYPLYNVSGEHISSYRGIMTEYIDQFMTKINKDYPIEVILK